VSYKDHGAWGTAQNLGQPINSEGILQQQVYPTMVNTLYIYQDNKSDAGDLYESELKGAKLAKAGAPEINNINTNFMNQPYQNL
jgi:hypothetical protein